MRNCRFIVLIVLFLSVPLLGQHGTSSVLINLVKVPFAFVVGDTMLPAGSYTIFSDSRTDLMHIRNVDTNDYVNVYTRNVDVLVTKDSTILAADKTKLVFRNHDGTYTLHQVWRSGDYHGHDVIHGDEVLELQEATK